jgi:hypothetical protein
VCLGDDSATGRESVSGKYVCYSSSSSYPYPTKWGRYNMFPSWCYVCVLLLYLIYSEINETFELVLAIVQMFEPCNEQKHDLF